MADEIYRRIKAMKDGGETMTKVEKILLLRIEKGLGLCEAVQELKDHGNYFDGQWSGP